MKRYLSRYSTSRRRRTLGGESKNLGSAAVEFAVLLPVILTLLLGAIEVASALNTQGALQNAAREGARYVITPGATGSACTEVCIESLNVNNVKEAMIVVSHDPTKVKAGTFITITVSAPYTSNSWLPAPRLLSGLQLSANVVMRKE